ncbi:MAG: hypothetical protein HYS12_00555 [Planctomycetes bacterium]|nr:hypothetical protein [Planctomycetota bacterium]
MHRRWQSGLVVALLVATGPLAGACTVFFAFDGKVAMAGDNEDWADPNTQMWFVPPTKDHYGIVYFGFGKGEYPKGGIARRKLQIPGGDITRINPQDLYGLPQAGMNDKGLFFGGAATEPVKAPRRPGKKRYDGQLEDRILRNCATVEEALKLIEPYEFNLVQGHWLFADKTGDSFIIEAGDVILRKKGKYQVITNFLQSRVEPNRRTCPRYKLVTETLSDEKALSADLVRSLLKATAMKSTQYSTVFNLSRGEVSIYRRGDFHRVAKVNLKAELRKGERAVKIGSLFER